MKKFTGEELMAQIKEKQSKNELEKTTKKIMDKMSYGPMETEEVFNMHKEVRKNKMKDTRDALMN